MKPLTSEEAAVLLRCAPETVDERARAGDLPGLKFGVGWIFPQGAFYQRLDEIALAEAQERRTPKPPAAIAGPPPTRRTKRTPPPLPQLRSVS